MGGRLEVILSRPRTLDIVALVVPTLVAVDITVVGHLFLAELILLLSLPFLLATGRAHVDRAMKVILGFGVLWLASQILTDLVRHTAFHDFARGWSRIIFTMSSLLALDLIFQNQRRRLALFGVGLSVGLLLGYAISPTGLQRADAWKFGLGFPITLLLVLVATRPRVQRIALLPVGILCAAAFLNLALGFRSLGGICFVAAGYVAFQSYSLRKAHGPPRLSLGRIVVVSGLTLLLGVGFLRGYEYAAAHGLLGQTAKAKYALQSSGRFKLIAPFVADRPTFYIGIEAIDDSPLIGHGSWARNPKYTTEALTDLKNDGYIVDPNLINELRGEIRIPAHSYLLEAWVDGGVLGGIFWLLILGLVGAVFLTLYAMRDILSPLIAFLMMYLTWSILLSPYGTDQRITAAYSILVMLYAWRRVRQLRANAVDRAPSSQRTTPA
jgi:O-antigen ligase